MIPLGVNPSTGGLVVLYEDEAGVDLDARVGSPTTGVYLTVIVKSGVTISSTDASIPALDMSGLPSGSQVDLVNFGSIKGKGGDGGRGSDGDIAGFSGQGRGGGGGGGAGTSVGVGGTATSPGSAGSNGTATTGGAAGSSQLSTATTYVAAENGEAGGDAISSGSVTLTITNASGNIWGGGGGGGGGGADGSIVIEPGAGGDIATAGSPSDFGWTSGGTAGYAVRGTAVSFVSGSGSPNVQGAVG